MQTFTEFTALRRQEVRIHQHPIALHGRQHRHQRNLGFPVQALEGRHLGQLGGEPVMEPEANVGILRSVVGGSGNLDLIEAARRRAFPSHVAERNAAVSEVMAREAVHVVAHGRAVEHIGLQHGVIPNSP